MALVNLAEYEAKAREILPLPVFDYYYGGAHDEITVRENCAAFQRLALHYHVLRGADRSDTTCSAPHSDTGPAAGIPLHGASGRRAGCGTRGRCRRQHLRLGHALDDIR